MFALSSILPLLEQQALSLKSGIESFESQSRRDHEQHQMFRFKQSSNRSYSGDYDGYGDYDDCDDYDYEDSFEEYLSDRLENEYATVYNIHQLITILKKIKVVYQDDYDEIHRLLSDIFDLPDANVDADNTGADVGGEREAIDVEPVASKTNAAIAIDYLKKLKLLIR